MWSCVHASFTETAGHCRCLGLYHTRRCQQSDQRYADMRNLSSSHLLSTDETQKVSLSVTDSRSHMSGRCCTSEQHFCNFEHAAAFFTHLPPSHLTLTFRSIQLDTSSPSPHYLFHVSPPLRISLPHPSFTISLSSLSLTLFPSLFICLSLSPLVFLSLPQSCVST
jgi:hypothetical protein